MEKYKLGEICSIVSGGTPLRSNPLYWRRGTIPWIKIGDITEKYVNVADEYITEEGLNDSTAKMLAPGTILYTIYASLGEVGILNIYACTNQAIAGITINNPDQIRNDYIYYYLKSKKKYICNAVRGVTQNNINISILRDFDVPLPSVAKQDKIITLLEKTTYIINNREIELNKFDELVIARFVELFDKCNNRVPLIDLCSIITDGTHRPPKFQDSGIPFIFVSNLANNKVTFDTEKYISEEAYNMLIKKTPLEEGDILLSTVGSYGHPAVVVDNQKFLFQRHIAYLKPKREMVNSFYLHSALLAPCVQRQIEEKVKGIAQKTLNLSEIRRITIPLPSIDEQNDFEEFVRKVDKSKVSVQKSLDEARLLFDSLMQNFFG